MSEERLRILRMLQEGKISVEEAEGLLTAVGSADAKEGAGGERTKVATGSGSGGELAGGRMRWLRVRVTNLDTGRRKVNVNIPLSLVGVGLSMARRFGHVPELENLDLDSILQAVREGAEGKIVEVDDEESREHVEVFVE